MPAAETQPHQNAPFYSSQLVEHLRLDNYHWLMTHCKQHGLGQLIARMLASQMVGDGAMPRWLGLSWRDFELLMDKHFNCLELKQFGNYGIELALDRVDEHAELRTLLLSHAEGDPRQASWLADILVAGCMGPDHLWQDLGLWSRADLKALIHASFTPLAQKNEHDMKWKKFFYKQLCIQEGVYTCRAPSCQVCNDYASCFGPE